MYKLKREKTTQPTEIEDVASKLSETRKVKPVSAVWQADCTANI